MQTQVRRTKKLDNHKDWRQNTNMNNHTRDSHRGILKQVIMSVDHSRRMFLSAAAGSVLLPGTARSYSRIIGANDRIQIGQIGCGHRAVGHRGC